MPTPMIYLIRVKGHLDDDWADWFDGLTIANQPNGETVLSALIADQAALQGLLTRIFNLGLPLLLVRLIDPTDLPDKLSRDSLDF
jgi:hypothetical protein